MAKELFAFVAVVRLNILHAVSEMLTTEGRREDKVIN